VTAGPVDVLRGDSFCSGTSYESDQASLANGVVVWGHFAYDDPETGHFDGCYLFVAGQFVPCPANPPNPGWGHVLP